MFRPCDLHSGTNMSMPWAYPQNPQYPGVPAGTYNSYMMDRPASNSREMRNKAEKMRRDKLNSYIGELAQLVPMVAKSAKRMDKTSILRLTATHLRIYQTLINGQNRPQFDLPKQVDQYILDKLVCEQLGGFLLVTTTAGKIVFISPSVENLLGYLQTDLMGQTIYNITSPDDHDKLRTYMRSEGELVEKWKKYFNVRMKRAGPRTEAPVYEPVRIMGVHSPAGTDYNSLGSMSPSSTTSSVNSCRDLATTSSSGSTNGNNENDILLFFVRVVRPEPITDRLLEASKEEYVTRHLIDGRIITCDHRISLVAGYMSDEVSGLSAFKFMHREDVRWVMIALRQMYDRGETKGSSCYRLLSRNGRFIYLRTFGFLEIDDQGTVESFICVNTVVCEREGLHLIHQMKQKYSAIINTTNNPIISELPEETNEPKVEEPKKVDEAVKHLITNLPSPSSNPRSTPSPSFHVYQQQNSNGHNGNSTNGRRESVDSTTSNNGSPPKYQGKIKTVLKRPSIEKDVSPYHKRFKSVSPVPQMQQSPRTYDPLMSPPIAGITPHFAATTLTKIDLSQQQQQPSNFYPDEICNKL